MPKYKKHDYDLGLHLYCCHLNSWESQGFIGMFNTTRNSLTKNIVFGYLRQQCSAKFVADSSTDASVAAHYFKCRFCNQQFLTAEQLQSASPKALHICASVLQLSGYNGLGTYLESLNILPLDVK